MYEDLRRLFRQLTSGEGLQHAVTPRRAVAIIKGEVGLYALKVPQASEALVRNFELSMIHRRNLLETLLNDLRSQDLQKKIEKKATWELTSMVRVLNRKNKSV